MYILFLFTNYSSAQEFEWASGLVGSGISQTSKILSDTDGNIIIMGYFNGTADFDPSASVRNLSASQIDVFFAKYSASGEYIWAKKIGGTGVDGGLDMSLDNNGNIYICGYFRNTADFDPSAGVFDMTVVSSDDGYFAKYDSDGNFIWAKSIGGSNLISVNSIFIDGNFNIYVSGDYRSTADFDPGLGTTNLTSSGAIDSFFGKYNSNGELIWIKSIGGGDSDIISSLEVVDSGNIYICGSFRSDCDFDPSGSAFNINSAGEDDGFIAKYDNSGNLLWAKEISGLSIIKVNDIKISSDNNIYIGGYFINTADFDPSASSYNITTDGSSDGFIAKYDDNGELIYAKEIEGSGSIFVKDLSLDRLNNIYISGYFDGTLDFDPSGSTSNMTSNGSNDAFFAKYYSNGLYQWSYSIGGIDIDRAESIFIDDNDNVLIAGRYAATADFDIGIPEFNLTTIRTQEACFAKYYQNFLPELSTIPIFNLKINAASSGGNISFDGNDNITQKGLAWDSSPNPTIALVTKSNNGSGDNEFTHNINGLVSGVRYYVRAYATNSVGTNYGNEISFVVPYVISLDGNQDGVLDSLQNNVYTFLDSYNTNYITIVSPSSIAINSVSAIQFSDEDYFFPFGQFEFKINATQANVRVIFHGSNDLSNYSYRKLFPDNTYKQFENVTFSTENIGGNQVAVATLSLTDGGPGDYDGEVNGIIYDPGGPALPITANIPYWEWWWMMLLIPGILYFYIKINKINLNKLS